MGRVKQRLHVYTFKRFHVQTFKRGNVAFQYSQDES